jgi:hypothetical protein
MDKLISADWWPYAEEGIYDIAGARGENPTGADLVRWLEPPVKSMRLNWKREASKALSTLTPSPGTSRRTNALIITSYLTLGS